MSDDERFEQILRACEALDVKTRLNLVQRLDRGLIVESPDGIRFGCRSRTEYKRVHKRKRSEGPIVEWIRSFGAGDVLFDIGANVGAFSLLAGRLHGDRLRVVAFEPGFETFASLARNVLLNGLDAVVTPLQIALSDRTGLQPFHYHEMGAGSALHALGEPVDYARRRFEPVATQPVPAFRLDDLVAQLGLPRPTRIKLDVDGIESRVLAGAAATLRSGACELWLELTDAEAGDAAPGETIAQLTGLGFEVLRRVDHDSSAVYPRVFDVFCRRV